VKKLFFFVVFTTLCCVLPVGMKRLTHGFHIGKMKLDHSFVSEWEPPVLSAEKQDEIMTLLSQPFHYLNRGAQCYVFESEDLSYVIKLFRFSQPQNPVQKFFRDKKRPKISEKVNELFSACKLAYTLVPEETGLVYLHLNLTENQLPTLFFKGPLGQSFSLPLDSYRFALQKKAEPLKDALLKGASLGKIEMYLDSILSLLVKRVDKGICNTDGNFFRNFGFIENRAVEIDFGNYEHDSRLVNPYRKKEEISRFTSSLRSWLYSQDPQWAFYLDEQMEKI
jgi:hypothetical protein